MAKPDTNTTETKTGNGNTAPAAAPPRQSLVDRMKAEGYKEARDVGKDGVIYSAEKTDKAPIIGLVYKEQMLAVQSERPFKAYFVQLLKPSKGVDSEGKVVDVPIGGELIVPDNAKLKQKLAPHLQVQDNDHVFALAMEPTHQMPLDGGKKMWVWDIVKLENAPRSRQKNGLPPANVQHEVRQMNQSALEFFKEQADAQAARA